MIKYILISITLLFVSQVFAQEATFVKNIGQMVNQKGEFNSEVQYIVSTKGYNVSFYNNHFAYELFRPNETDSNKTLVERIEVWWEENNKSTKIIPENKQAETIHYYKNGKRFENIPTYSKLTYRNLWKGVDVEFFIQDGSLKYNYIVQGNKTKQISLLIKGAKSTKEKNTIQLQSLHHTVEASFPEIYFIDQQGKKTETTIDIHLHDNKIIYSLPDIQEEKLIIDPIVYNKEYVTYYGGAHMDFTYDIHSTKTGNIAITGYTVSANNIATTGAYQTVLTDQDAYVAMFNNQGVRLWATYFGGTSAERIYSSAIDTNDNIIIAGNTTSTIGLATNGSFQQYIASGDDGFVTKFSSTGQLLWSTYYGGDAHELIIRVETDKNNKIYVTGHTSSTNLQCTPNAFRNYLSGYENSFLGIFDAQGNIVYNSYYLNGSSARGEAILFDSDDNIYLAGSTNDTVTSPYPNVHQAQNAGYLDGFVIKINPQYQTVWKTYLGGWHNDLIYGVVVDSVNNLYFGGKTKSNDGISTSSSFQYDYDNNWDGFLVKMDSSSNVLWGTYLTAGGADEVHSLAYYDSSVWVLENTDGNGFPVSTSALQTSNAGGVDNLLMRFSSQGNLQWASYFGGVSNEFGHRIRLLPRKILLAGQTGSSTSFTTSNAHQVNYGGHIYDGYWARLCLPVSSTILNLVNDTVLCLGDSVTLFPSNTFNSYQWNTGATDSVLAVSQAGSYSLVTYDENNCPGYSDTIQVIFETVSQVSILNSDTSICMGDSVLLSINGSFSSYLWNNGNTDSAQYVTNGQAYFAQVSSTLGCTYFSDTVLIKEQTQNFFPIQMIGDTIICSGGNSILYTDENLNTIQWSTGDLVSGITVDTTGVFWFMGQDTLGCTVWSDSISITEINYSSPDLILDTTSTITTCWNDSVILVAEIGFTQYLWSTGDTLQQEVIVSQGYYFVSATDSNGCVGISDSVFVEFVGTGVASVDTAQGTSFCLGDTLLLSVADTSLTNVLWNNTLQNQDTLRIIGEGEYYFSATDSLGCMVYSDTVHTLTLLPPNVEIQSPTDSVCLGDSIHLSVISSSNLISYNWSNGETDLSFYYTFLNTGYQNISVEVSDNNGCRNTNQINIYVFNCALYNSIVEQKIEVNGFITQQQTVFITAKQMIFSIEVYDVTGRRLSVQKNIQSYTAEVHLAEYRKSIYLLKVVTTDNREHILKIKN